MGDNLSSEQKICFVIMGFGRKTDYELGRTLDLDATYEAIIQPAVEDNNMRCVRANEILHSGIIDQRMYEMLLRADLVIADISTGNVNAVYELGVRHALRPYSTIVMKERVGQIHFDLNHINIFPYDHMGDDIGSREQKRASSDLRALIAGVMQESETDSPVYTCFPHLTQPTLTKEEFEDLVDAVENVGDKFSTLLNSFEDFSRLSNHDSAVTTLKNLLEMKPDDHYLIQQLALHTYKSEKPNKVLALTDALSLIMVLNPDNSNDPETLGITGAIYKNLWLAHNERGYLDRAIKFYERGFDVRRDYYNGENAANCYQFRSCIQEVDDERMFDRMSAMKIRKEIVSRLNEIVISKDFEDRSDKRWIYATLSNSHLALGDQEKFKEFASRFFECNPFDWEKKTFCKTVKRIRAMV
ncbi:TRAFs-binding domain-containing protein [Thalassospira mesophila]|uniref:DUF4071 domain-containing protein n=1 Tax=Thalassospira mesophila TaxID=1293891 RepID=A0A1Y2KXS8_9PROT|nr:TRAFs-binding domain-containing protein [Thalassospira mesophila]OSQ37213.1 hypothetical protein TMES_15500 [Thalassospira mesophila]